MSGAAGWLSDAALGIRLAVGGGRITRTGVIRLVLTTVGLGLATAILLAAASMGHAVSTSQARENGRSPQTQPRDGVAALQVGYWSMQSAAGRTIAGRVVHATGPNSPVPPGLDRVPDAGETVVSPALHRLLDSADGGMLRQRLPGDVAGEIGKEGLPHPDTVAFVAGAGPDLGAAPGTKRVYDFGGASQDEPLAPPIVLLMIVGVTVLLVPVLAFVVTVSRIAGAERDRRLSALRLAGCGAGQVRRIAAAEALVGALAGLGVGTVLFLIGRMFAGDISVLGYSFYSSDVTPPWPLAVVVALLVPLLAVGAALFAQRRTVVEPLGVFRQAKPVRRRILWRVAVFVLGVAALALAGVTDRGGFSWGVLLVVGTLGILCGLAVLLPWLVERAVSRLRGGRPSWQLATRRLQLDSGTPSRVVAGLTVVLAGAIALQSMLSALDRSSAEDGPSAVDRGSPEISTDVAHAPDVARALGSVPDVAAVNELRPIATRLPRGGGSLSVSVADCATITWLFATRDCHDGEAFRGDAGAGDGRDRVASAAGRTLAVGRFDQGDFRESGTLRVPDEIHSVRSRGSRTYATQLILTPGVVGDVDLPDTSVTVLADFDGMDSATRREVYTVLAPFGWHASTYIPGLRMHGQDGQPSAYQRQMSQVRDALLAGSLFVLLLAGASLLVLATEQVRERRRSLAALAASGVPRAVLARSLLWQTLVPVVLGTVAASVGGVVLAGLVLAVAREPFGIDWQAIGTFSVAAMVLAALVTAGALPLLRGVTRLESLRTE